MTKEVTHGKPSTYNNHKCRCRECTDAWAKYMAPRIKAHRDKKRRKKAEPQTIEINF